MSDVRYYSLRRLSPYQGTVQVVECPGFRAMSPDGNRWRVQFLNQRTRLSSYGVWRADGSGNLIETERTQPIIDALRTHPALPFRLGDRLELWLLDARDRLPLALLTSTISGRAPPAVTVARWRAALGGDEEFLARSLLADDASDTPISHCDVLERCVQRAAGAQPQAQWFERAPDGSGRGTETAGLDAALAPRDLPASAFPPLLLREQWDNERENALVREYHEWHAAQLLTHSNLSRPTRTSLEVAACRQATKLYRVRHLLPEVINGEMLEVALVEAVIRQSV